MKMNKQEYKNWIENRSIARTYADSEKGDAELGFDYAVSLFVARDAKIREVLGKMRGSFVYGEELINDALLLEAKKK